MFETTSKVNERASAWLAAPLIALLAVLLLSVSLVSGDENTTTQNNVEKRAVSLTIATVLSSTKMAFEMTNTGEKAITVHGLQSGSLSIIFVKPDGKTVKFHSEAGPPGIGSLPVLQPGQTQRWDVDVTQFFGRELTERGLYRLTWTYTQPGEPSLVTTSNEVFIRKDEESPRFNPTTGQPE